MVCVSNTETTTVDYPLPDGVDRHVLRHVGGLAAVAVRDVGFVQASFAPGDGTQYQVIIVDGVIPHPDFRCEVHRFATDCIADSNLRHQARTHVDTVPWFRDLPVVPGAVDGINALAAHPAVSDVFICTKPLESNTSCRDDKAAWVRRHLGGDWERRLILAPDKSMVRGHILLDDAPKPQWFKFAEWTPVVYPTSWNSPGGVFSTKAEVNDAPRWQWGDPVESLLEAVLP